MIERIRIRHYESLSLACFDGADAELRQEDSGSPYVYGRIVPYDDPTPIAAGVWEVMHRGALDRTLRERQKAIDLRWGHSIEGMPIGGVESFESKDDGMYVRFGLNNTTVANDARELLRSGHATGLSVGFLPVKGRTYDTENDDGSVTLHRTEIRLDHVAFTHRPAYPAAQVTSFREEPEQVEPAERAESPEPPPDTGGIDRVNELREKYGFE